MVWRLSRAPSWTLDLREKSYNNQIYKKCISKHERLQALNTRKNHYFGQHKYCKEYDTYILSLMIKQRTLDDSEIKPKF